MQIIDRLSMMVQAQSRLESDPARADGLEVGEGIFRQALKERSKVLVSRLVLPGSVSSKVLPSLSRECDGYHW